MSARFLKNFDDTDSLELIAWTQDEAIDYVDTPDTPIGEGYVKLKEITDGSGICRPVDDLLYGRIAIDAGLRENRNIVTIPFVRAVCRTRITMIPQTVEIRSLEEERRVLQTALFLHPKILNSTFTVRVAVSIIIIKQMRMR